MATTTASAKMLATNIVMRLKGFLVLLSMRK